MTALLSIAAGLALFFLGRAVVRYGIGVAELMTDEAP